MAATRSPKGRAFAIAFAVAALLLATAGVIAYALTDFHGNTYAGYQLLIGLIGISVGAFVAYRRTDHPLGWILLAGGFFSTLTFAGSSILDWMIVNTPEQETLGRTILASSIWGWIAFRGCFVVLAPLVFPLGWPRRRWEIALFAVSVLAIVLTCVAHGRLWTFEYFQGLPPVGSARLAEDVLPWGHRAIWVLSLIALTLMIVRVMRQPARERAYYLPFAVTTAVLAIPSLNSLYAAAYGEYFWELSDDVELWTAAAMPLVLAFAVLRHGVLDITVVVRRATVYGLLAALAIVVYVGVVAVSSLFVQSGAGIGPAIATGLIAVGVLPVHAWLERVVARRMFGNRANPYEVVTAFGHRLEQAPADDDALQLVATTLREQLRVPFVAIDLESGLTTVQAARAGEPGPPTDRYPLTYQGEHIGSLVVAQRTEREPFRASERELLTAFARQAGVVAHNAALAQALRRSRSVLVHAREDERRRIRRDLHDGLGPTLATVSLSLGAAAERLHDDPELSLLLRDLEGEVGEAIVDIRRLVYDLRPPALDDLGLIGALRTQASQIGGESGNGRRPRIDVTDSQVDAGLPSAVELAAYRVAVEAMTNVVRHAHAATCVVAVERNHALVVRVEDDGIGFTPEARQGVGLQSMNERAIELGGVLRIEPRVPTGTIVTASFPLEDGR